MLPTFGMLNNNILTTLEQEPANPVNLMQNYPNPFSGYTNIVFEIDQAAEVILNVYNIQGSKVETLVAEYLPSGKYTHQWDANHLPSGIYIGSISVNGHTYRIKMILQ